MNAQFLYGGAGILLFAIGLWSLLVHESLVRKLIAINIAGGGVFHVFIAIAYRGDSAPPDPVPHALVLTGIVVAVSATALALALNRRLEQLDDDDTRDASASPPDTQPMARSPETSLDQPANGHSVALADRRPAEPPAASCAQPAPGLAPRSGGRALTEQGSPAASNTGSDGSQGQGAHDV